MLIETLSQQPKDENKPKVHQLTFQWNISTMEYYSAVKKNEILIHVSTRMNLENIMLHKRSQSQKNTYCMIPFA